MSMKKPYNYVIAGNGSAVFCGEKQMSVTEVVDSLNELLDALEMFVSNSSIQTNYPDYCDLVEKLIAKHRGEK